MQWSFVPHMTIVGLLEAAVQESRARVQMALRNTGQSFIQRRMIVNLTLASVRKEGQFIPA